MFNTDFYIHNRRRLATACGEGLIIIAGNGLLQRTGDTNYPFRQDSNFLYLTGVVEPNSILVINTKDNFECIIVPDKDEVQKIFDGESNIIGIQKVSGISVVIGEKEGWNYIKQKSTASKIFFNNPVQEQDRGVYANPNRSHIYKKIKRLTTTIEDVRPYVAKLRMIKQAQEIKAIQQAITITKEALHEAQKQIERVNTEQELLMAVNAVFTRHNVEHAYEPIVAAGKNAVTLHYTANNQALQSHDAVLFDVGAEYSGYAADISRTFIQGENKRAEEIIQAVESIQQKVIQSVKPGVTWKRLSEYALELTAIELKKLGVITDSKDVHAYFPHAIGHFLGLDVHDVGDYSLPLAEGMVITVEPGIYLAKEGIGVRIEDDILVTKTGAKVL